MTDGSVRTVSHMFPLILKKGLPQLYPHGSLSRFFPNKQTNKKMSGILGMRNWQTILGLIVGLDCVVGAG
jgi:hypothetical protein